MSYYCSNKDCPNMQRSFSSKAFFSMPNDDRREIWIKNSGNDKLNEVDPGIRRVFCEDHFDPKYLRKQFNRTILRREAIPFPFDDQKIEFIEIAEPETEDESEHNPSDQIESANEENETVIVLNKESNYHLQHQRSTPMKNVPKITYSKRAQTSINRSNRVVDEEHNVKVDFIVLEDQPNTLKKAKRDSSQLHENEGGSSACKKIRIKMDSTSDEHNKSSQQVECRDECREECQEEHQEEERDDNVNEQANPILQKTKTKLPQNTIEGIVSSSETFDSNSEETYFALSLVGILKRLPPHKRAIAKCHIFSYLTELEYGSSS